MRSGAKALFGRFLPKIDVETTASLRARRPGLLQDALELAASAALLPEVALRASVDDLLASMQRARVSRSVVIASPPTSSNDWLLGAAAAHPDALIPVVAMPALSADAHAGAWSDALERLAERGARGFKIHPNMDAVRAPHAAYDAVFEVAQRRRLFVILHTGCFHAVVYRRHEDADPARFASLFERYPTVKVCLAHMGREHPEPIWALMRCFPQLYTDTSWQPVEMVRRALTEVSSERILLGSDWPLLSADVQIDAAETLRTAVGADADAKLSGNALAFLDEGRS